jgi:perosamine synthetase
MKNALYESIIKLESTMKDVLLALDRAGAGIVFVVDSPITNRLVGVFTDGDARRAFLRGAVMESPVEQFMTRDFVHGKAGNARETNILLLSGTIRDLPILDDSGVLIDFISREDVAGIPVTRPTLGGNELKYVTECINTNWISSQGAYVKRFEENFARFVQAGYAVTTSNGTTALHLAIAALGIGPGDEVIVPNLTFAASANAVLHAGGTPVLADVSLDHWTLDPAGLEKLITPKTKAIMPVHLYGHPCDMDPIMEIARKHNLYVVEDCAESIGAQYRGRSTGSIGHIGCFSFFSNKVVTTGEGGMCVTSDPELRQKMMILRDHGMSREKRYWHDIVGYNYRMTNLQAAIGVAQLEQVELFLANRRLMARRYAEELSQVPGIALPPEMSWAKNIYWLYSIQIDFKKLGVSKEMVMKALAREGIETRPFFYPLHIQPAYLQYAKGEFPNTELLSAQGISLPTSNDTTHEEIVRVCGSLKKILMNKDTRSRLSSPAVTM